MVPMAEAARRARTYFGLRGAIFAGAVRARHLPNGRWLVDSVSLDAWIRARQKAAAKQAPQREGAEAPAA